MVALAVLAVVVIGALGVLIGALAKPRSAPRASATPSRRRSWWRSPFRLLLVALIVAGTLVLLRSVVALSALWLALGPGFDSNRFDELEAAFDRERAAFVDATDRMRALVNAHPRATRIVLTSRSICVHDAGQDVDWIENCEPASPDDQAMLEALGPPVYRMEYRAKDDGHMLFRTHNEDPPTYTIMHAPDETDIRAYARDRGYRSNRTLEPGWTILGPIDHPDRDAREE